MQKIQYKWKNQSHPKPQRSKLQNFAVRAAHYARLPEEFGWVLSVEFVNDNIMAKRNWDLLGHEGTTDVITFCYFDDEFPEMLEGETAIELIVNPEAAAREGAKRPGGYCREVALYIVHGMLHSAGEDDLEEAVRRRMRRRERECMSILENEFDLALLFPGA